MKEKRMFYGASRNIFRNAFLLRNNETTAEKALWKRLNRNQLGIRFKRQHPIEDFVADFYCHKAKLVIEVDGNSHNSREQKFYDEIRTSQMAAHGLKVIRFSNEEVLNNIDKVIISIKHAIEES